MTFHAKPYLTSVKFRLYVSQHNNVHWIFSWLQPGFDKFTHKYLCTPRTHQCFKGTVINRAITYLHQGLVAITRTVSLNLVEIYLDNVNLASFISLVFRNPILLPCLVQNMTWKGKKVRFTLTFFLSSMQLSGLIHIWWNIGIKLHIERWNWEK